MNSLMHRFILGSKFLWITFLWISCQFVTFLHYINFSGTEEAPCITVIVAHNMVKCRKQDASFSQPSLTQVSFSSSLCGCPPTASAWGAKLTCSLDVPTHIPLPRSRAASFQFSHLIDVVTIGMSQYLCKSTQLRQAEQADCKAFPSRRRGWE